jgi:hypothetical protein
MESHLFELPAEISLHDIALVRRLDGLALTPCLDTLTEKTIGDKIFPVASGGSRNSFGFENYHDRVACSGGGHNDLQCEVVCASRI